MESIFHCIQSIRSILIKTAKIKMKLVVIRLRQNGKGSNYNIESSNLSPYKNIIEIIIIFLIIFIKI